MNKTKDPTMVEPAVGQVYEDDRGGSVFQILYIDGHVVLFRSEHDGRNGSDKGHRIETRTQFDRQLDAGRMKYKPKSDVDLLEQSDVDWNDVDHIGKMTAENLQHDGYETIIDVRQADDAELLMVDGLGVAGLENLREFVK